MTVCKAEQSIHRDQCAENHCGPVSAANEIIDGLFADDNMNASNLDMESLAMRSIQK